MNRPFSFFSFIVVAVTLVRTDVDSQERRHPGLQYQSFESQIRGLEQQLTGAAADRINSTLRDLCTVHFTRARFLKSLWESSLVVQMTYFAELDSAHRAGPIVKLCQGIGLFERGDYAKAIGYLSAASSSRGLTKDQSQIADSWRAAGLYMNGQQDDARRLWESLPQRGLPLQSEVFYLKVRVNADSGVSGIIKGASVAQPSRISKNLAYVLGRDGRLPQMRESSSRADPQNPAFVENAGTISETRYYDPDMFLVLSRASLLLAADCARQLASRATDEEKKHLGVNGLLGACALELGEYRQAIQFLAGCDDPTSRGLLAAAYARVGDRQDAENTFRALADAAPSEALSEMGRAFVGIPGYSGQLYSADVCRKALNLAKVQTAAGKRPPQSLYRNLAIALLKIGQKEEALNVLSEGYRRDLQDNLVANDPEYIVRFAAAMVEAAHFRTLSSAARMLLPVLAVYPAVAQMSEPIAKIDVLTIGKDGRGVVLTH